MTAPDPVLHRVVLTLCSACVDGLGEECHTPGCALWMNRPPAHPIRNSCAVETIDGAPFDYETLKRSADEPAKGERLTHEREVWLRAKPAHYHVHEVWPELEALRAQVEQLAALPKQWRSDAREMLLAAKGMGPAEATVTLTLAAAFEAHAIVIERPLGEGRVSP